MHLSDHSLRQIDDAYLRSLDAEALCGLSVRLLADWSQLGFPLSPFKAIAGRRLRLPLRGLWRSPRSAC